MIKYLKNTWRLIYDSQKFIYQGIKKNLFKDYFKVYSANLLSHLAKFHHQLQQMSFDSDSNEIISTRAKGLHSLLPNAQNFQYSILIKPDSASLKFLQSTLLSACMQSPPNFEILISPSCAKSSEIENCICKLKAQNADIIRFIDCAHTDTDASFFNYLASQAKGNYLLFVESGDLLRPDLLYRYEQLLRTVPNPEKMVVDCYENRANENGFVIPGSIKEKLPYHFPYVFQDFHPLRGMLISKMLWEKVNGLNNEYTGSEVEDLILRLDLAGANFSTIPICLYSQQIGKGNTSDKKDSLIKTLTNYSKNKGLDWTFEPGYLENSARAKPKIIERSVQVVVPYKNQKEMTMRCIESVNKQKGVNFTITAVDNGSDDRTIGQELQEMGVEVLRIEEPFNYSRLNNLAVANTAAAKNCKLVLFLNNDVELSEDALQEMIRWIDQPSIGIVGARLHYPNGLLQHGGIMLKKYHLADQLWWHHSEKLESFDDMHATKKQSIVDAVTAACALMKKEDFIKVGGFDEVLYPIAFSDTNLILKLNKLGLKSFYTPYAFGTHHESISRKQCLEDVESSRWLAQLAEDAKQ